MFGCSPLPRPACVCPAGGDDPRLPVSTGGREKLVLADTAAQPSYLLPALVRQGLRYQLTTDNDNSVARPFNLASSLLFTRICHVMFA